MFQAEDGIRDLVRSRGLGDVYKRQRGGWNSKKTAVGDRRTLVDAGMCPRIDRGDGDDAVSYTHLTLPTSDLV